MKIQCKEVWVKFKQMHLQGQRMRHTEHTSSTYLEVTLGELYVVVEYKNSADQLLKVIIFNKNEILEVEPSEILQAELD